MKLNTYKIQSTANKSETLLGSISTDERITTKITNDPLGIDGSAVDDTVITKTSVINVSILSSSPFNRAMNTDATAKNTADPELCNTTPNEITNFDMRSS